MLPIFQRTVTNSSGDVLPGASVEVRRESDNVLVQLYADRAGTVLLPNPTTADGDGFVQFFAASSNYKITATSGAGTVVWRYVDIGSADVRSDLSAQTGAAMVGYQPAGAGAVPTDVQSKLREISVTPQDFMTAEQKMNVFLRLGTLDVTEAVQKAIDYSFHVFAPPGVYLHGPLVLKTGLHLQGAGMGATEFLLKPSAMGNAFTGVNTSYVTLSDFKTSGQKNLQPYPGSTVRGIYLQATTGECKGIRVSRVWINEAQDHGLFFSGSNSGIDSVVSECLATGCGIDNPAIPGGTGFVGGSTTTTYAHCQASGNYRNGFKSGRATHMHCESNNNQGGFESGFGAENPANVFGRYIGCRTSYCGAGFRHQGEGDLIQMIGCVAEYCDTSGISVVNNVSTLIVDGYIGRNNGQNFTRSTTVGGAGIDILASTGVPSEIILNNYHIFDDQATKTQDYGIYVSANAANVVIGQGVLGPQKESRLWFDLGNPNTVRVSPMCVGYEVNHINRVAVTVTGTTTATTLMTQTIPARSLRVGSVFRVRGRGAVTGTAGQKIVRFYAGTTGSIFINMNAATTGEFWVDFTVAVQSNSAIRVSGIYSISGSTPQSFWFAPTWSITAATEIKFEAQLFSAADSVTMQMMHMAAEE